jgi:hypothetical protein
MKSTHNQFNPESKAVNPLEFEPYFGTPFPRSVLFLCSEGLIRWSSKFIVE